MTEFAKQDLRFLVVEDSSFFRTAINNMLNSLGASKVDTVDNGSMALEYCQNHHFDVILCDQNLGNGKNGQQVLEALRHFKLINETTIFMMVTADASRQAVLASSDVAADDYLAKPINAMVLQRRISRLLQLKRTFRSVWQALVKNQHTDAINHLTRLAKLDARFASHANKILGEVYLQTHLIDQAEDHYRTQLMKGPFEWAYLGLGYVYQAKGELDESNQLFNGVVRENPWCLSAYDGLAKNYHSQQDYGNLQTTIAKAVNVSPMSILRQKNLANIAEQNGDLPTALKALRECVRLGHHSCHGDWSDAYRFGMNTADAPQALLDEKNKLPHEALKILKDATNFFKVPPEELLRMQFLKGRLQFLMRELGDGKNTIYSAETEYESEEKKGILTDIARVKAIHTLNEHERANELANALTQQYANDQTALQLLDQVLDEPTSQHNRKLLAEANKTGIELYNNKQFDEAILCFERARVLFPRHIGIQLNICQAYLGKQKRGDTGDIEKTIDTLLAHIKTLIKPEDTQYSRFKKLQNMAEQAKY